MRCRHCHAPVNLPLMDLGSSPPSNAYLSDSALAAAERWYPLRVFVCTACWLVQTEDYAHVSELFASDYAYFSSVSTSWLDHAERYVDEVVRRFDLGPSSRIVEIACNDGYLLQYVRKRGLACLGVEPTAATARAARDKGIPVIERFFGLELAGEMVRDGNAADLVVANNVLAHVPDIGDFVAGVTRLLKPGGVATFEFPSLVNLVELCQFDTIYHEHFSYLSLTTVSRLFEGNGLRIFDVQEHPTHGGSLRVFACRSDGGIRPVGNLVGELRMREMRAGVCSEAFYAGFQPRADRIKDNLLAFLIKTKRDGKRVGAYGAAAKGNTLLNYAGVRKDLLPWVVDRNPAKVGRYLPGCRIPIVTEERLHVEQPDFVLILPWNLRAEIATQLSQVRAWGGKFVTAVPELEIF